jgi:hypothetical protein
MDKNLLEGTRPGISGKDGTYDLPILYYRDNTALATFTADTRKVREFLPSENLYPIPLTPGRCLISLAMFNYIHTTIGPYGELAFAIPVMHKKNPRTPIPALRQSSDPRFGMWICHLPVTSQIALRAGRDEWNYPKFISDMTFEINDRYMECDLASEGKKIIDLRVENKGFIMRENRPLVSFTIQDGSLVRCLMSTRSVLAQKIWPGDSFLKVYPGHPMSNDWLALDPSEKPILTQNYYERFLVLPRGTIVEHGTKEWNGYNFTNNGRDGRHTTTYDNVIINAER